MEWDGLGYIKHPIHHGDLPALGEQHAVHLAGLQVGIDDRDFENIYMVGVDDHGSLSWDPFQLHIVDAADQAGNALKDTYYKTM
jgi:hypothetical protein